MVTKSTTREQAIRAPFRGSGWVARADFELMGHQERARALAEEIAVGQSLGSWSTSHAPFEVLSERVARLLNEQICPDTGAYRFTVEFPEHLWHGNLSWLVKIVFGKMSFVPGVRWTGLHMNFLGPGQATPSAFGPQHSTDSLRTLTQCPQNRPLLMGILKPAVALSDRALTAMVLEAGSAGLNLIKDDEIRHDQSLDQVLRRVEMVSKALEKAGLPTLYVVHYQNFSGRPEEEVRRLSSAGARAFLVCPWTDGLQTVQALRSHTDAVIASHPALAGAFGACGNSSIAPAVALGMLPRLAGADLSLFPSPYGSIGLPHEEALSIARALRVRLPSGRHSMSRPSEGGRGEKAIRDTSVEMLKATPVPSAGIKPEHVSRAREDFGTDHILNAGTAIFADPARPAQAVKAFLKEMELR